jgi:uncharacterized protein
VTGARRTDDPDFAGFYAACTRGTLAVPVCGEGHLTWPPRPRCVRCQLPIAGWRDMSGSGRLYSWTIVHRTRQREFADRVPYIVGIVALDEDPAVRVVGTLPGIPAQQLRVGLPLQVAFDPADGEYPRPEWHLR